MTPFLRKLGPKIQFLRSFTNFFWNYTGLQHKLLMLIESPNICDWNGNQLKKVNWVSSVGQNLVQCEKTKKNWYFNGFS